MDESVCQQDIFLDYDEWSLKRVLSCIDRIKTRDSHSPFLFFLVKKAPSRMLEATTEASLIQGFKCAIHAQEITHFLFANNTLLYSRKGASRKCQGHSLIF